VVPVALASVTAGALRITLLGLGPVFPVPAHAAALAPTALLACAGVGLLAGAASSLLTEAVYAAEDAFARLPIHWMWWPALGAIVVGIGGYIFPQALGVGYDVIGRLLQGDAPTSLVLGVLFVKSTIWAVALGSGTSGGVLAPILMVGCALGGLEARWLPNEGAGFWSLVSMGAVLGGTMRAPLTGVVFAMELTHDINSLLPLLLAVGVSYAFTALILKRSILTEKISRRGYHLSCEYAIDPLEIIFAREVVRTGAAAVPAKASREAVARILDPDGGARERQRLFPVVDEGNRVVGVVTRRKLRRWSEGDGTGDLGAIVDRGPVLAFDDEPLRVVVYRMAETGVTRLPVVSSANRTLVGMLALEDLLKARRRTLDAEHRRERVLFRDFGWPPSSAHVDVGHLVTERDE